MGVFKCYIAHCRFVAVLCMLYDIGVTRWTHIMVDYLYRMCQCGLHVVPGRTSVHLCATKLQNLAVSQDFYYSFSVPVERSCWARIRWCGNGRFQEQSQYLFIFLSCSIPTIAFYYFSLSLLSVYWLVLRLGSSDRLGVYLSLSALHCRLLLIIIIIMIKGNGTILILSE